jgi:hypothetical protein
VIVFNKRFFGRKKKYNLPCPDNKFCRGIFVRNLL